MSEPIDYEHVFYELIQEVARMRDRLRPIVDGKIERGRSLSRYTLSPGFRKTKLSDARKICETVIARLNAAINKADAAIHPNIFPSREFGASPKSK